MSQALLVIDMQRDFCEAGGYAAACGLDIALLRQPIEPTGRLIAAARQNGIAVIYTREGHRPDLADCHPAKLARSAACGASIGAHASLGRHLVRGEPGHDVVPELAPAAGDPIVDKPGYGAFYQTDLELLLQARGTTHLYVTGVTTDICVHSTLREAIDRGYECVTVADACAAADVGIHSAALGLIEGPEGPILGRVRDTATVLADWGRGQPAAASNNANQGALT
ncbi:cysteine hydrolase family protein [Salinisphaera sp. LB1]|uniref:cysteine hydrolase family protein n=1 Tax=Salinisphaera sp. LB1 TaxID=2183911 RepID=UPI000D7076C1|nr:isochorismatase family cysteine hydrolase [Salinisphaera sp. LB1]AWN14655.1 Isochorismatase [Salinisphaera sp. LB1]